MRKYNRVWCSAVYSQVVSSTTCNRSIFFFGGGKIWSEGFKKQTIITNWQNGRSEWRPAEKADRRSASGAQKQGIPVSTYYSWQRKVFQAAATEPEVCFTEISARPAGRGTAASIEIGELRIEIHAGADAETVRAIIQVLKEC